VHLDFSQFIEWAFLFVISGGVGLVIRVLTKLNASINDLNITVGQIIVKHESQEKDISILKNDINYIKSHYKPLTNRT
jgi:hypothetical protein